MDTFDTLYRTPDERAIERGKRSFWNDWENASETLGLVQVDALAFLSTLEGLRSDTIWAKDIEEIDFFAADFAGGLCDLISNRIGRAKRRGEERGIDGFFVDCETDVFTEEADKWLARAKARRAERVYMTAADLGLSELDAFMKEVS